MIEDVAQSFARCRQTPKVHKKPYKQADGAELYALRADNQL
jgi:hypothetical protein